jgi:hypothetical protein
MSTAVIAPDLLRRLDAPAARAALARLDAAPPLCESLCCCKNHRASRERFPRSV